MERSYPSAAVTPKAEAAILRGHPWVYGEEITASDSPENGSLVDVRSRKGAYLGTGFWSEHSKIRVRRGFLGTETPVGLGVPENRHGTRRPGRLPDCLW